MLGIDNRKEEMKEDSHVSIWITWKSFSGMWTFRGGRNRERHKGISCVSFGICLTEVTCDTSKERYYSSN